MKVGATVSIVPTVAVGTVEDIDRNALMAGSPVRSAPAQATVSKPRKAVNTTSCR
jgi:hypothetical protein